MIAFQMVSPYARGTFPYVRPPLITLMNRSNGFMLLFLMDVPTCTAEEYDLGVERRRAEERAGPKPWVRSFPHERGNWPTHVYIPGETGIGSLSSPWET